MENPERRSMRIVSIRPQGEDVLRDSAILQRTLNRLRGPHLVPRGVYRFNSHEEADAWMRRQIADTHAPELEDLTFLCRALNRDGVRYVLIGGFAVVLQGLVRTTKDIVLLVDPSDENVRRLKRALGTLKDNAIGSIGDDELRKYVVVRVADEVVVDLMAEACGISYEDALAAGVDRRRLENVEIPVASKETLIRTKASNRDADRMDIGFLREQIEAEQRTKPKS